MLSFKCIHITNCSNNRWNQYKDLRDNSKSLKFLLFYYKLAFTASGMQQYKFISRFILEIYTNLFLFLNTSLFVKKHCGFSGLCRTWKKSRLPYKTAEIYFLMWYLKHITIYSIFFYVYNLVQQDAYAMGPVS